MNGVHYVLCVADSDVSGFGDAQKLETTPAVKSGKTLEWSAEKLREIETLNFSALSDDEFRLWLGDDELQQLVKLVLPDVPVASTLTVEQGKALGMDDAAFRPGQAFSNKALWREVTRESPHLMRWVTEGYSVYVDGFHQIEQMRAVQGKHIEQHAEFVTQEVEKLKKMEVIEDITNVASSKDEARCIMGLVVAVNGEGKKRLCWNGKQANALWNTPSFKFEGLEVALGLMQPGDFMFGLDLQRGTCRFP